MKLLPLSIESIELVYEEMKKNFVPEEIRDKDGAAALFSLDEYTILGIYENDILVGFISLWDLDGVHFIEHFVVFEAYRGLGYGKECLDIVKRDFGRLLLEAETPMEDIQKRRIAFYERCGFKQNPYYYLQPPYRFCDTGVHLVLMSYPDEIEDFAKVKELLYEKVYKQKRPVIAVSCGCTNEEHRLFATYTEAIRSVGGVPIILPFPKSISEALDALSSCDGLLLTGGRDIDPRRFGEEILNESVDVDVRRDEAELICFDAAKKLHMPIMAICRGMQLVNVALGGSLYQDIPSQYKTDITHRQSEPKTSPSHSVNIVEGSPLSDLIKANVMCANSFHHQAVKKLGHGLCPMAYADDGIVEAFCSENQSFIRAYQWHPERLAHCDTNNKNLFAEFVGEATAFKNGKKS